MKKIYTLASAFLLTFGLTAQIQETAHQMQSTPIAKLAPNFNMESTHKAPSPEAIYLIWSDDFSTPTNWTFTGGANEWNVVNTVSSGLIAAGVDATINSTSGGNFGFIDSDTPGQTGTQDAYLTYNGSIDCSANPDVRLTFETYLTQYLETREVQVSNNGGATWDTYTVLEQFLPNTSSPNAITEVVNINPTAGGQANVMIRFHYVGAWDWYWCVDDVSIVTAPENDLALNQEYYNGYQDSTESTYYTLIPERHAGLDTLTYGAAFSNEGSNDLTNTVVEVNVNYGGSSVFSEVTAPITSVSGVSDSANVIVGFSPSFGLGVYNITMGIGSDSLDENTANDTIRGSFEVTTNEYARDNGIGTEGNWFDATSDWEMLNLFQINANDTCVAISVEFPTLSNGRGLAVGDAISYYLYRDSDLENPVAKNEFHLVTASEVDAWITLPMPAVTLTPGYYYAGFKIYNDNSAVSSNTGLNENTPPFTVLVRTDAASPSEQWSYTTGLTPFIHMFTSEANACDNVTINVNDSVVLDNQEIGEIYITVDGGTPTYTYSWTGPNGYTSSVQNPNDIAAQGTYSVVVSDVFGCTGSLDVTVAGIVTVDELGFNNSLSLFPNPNKGTFKITAENVADGEYTIVVRNVLGQQVYVEVVSANGRITKDIQLSNLNNGVYFLEISNEIGSKSLIKFIVE